MKSDSQLLEMYKEEKSLIIGGIKDRTGLEEFPPFKEWKLEYMKEYAETHDIGNPMSMEEAVASLEAEIEADNDDLIPDEDLAVLMAETPELDNEEIEMTESTNNTEATAAAAETTTKAPSKSKTKSTGAKTVKKPGSKKSTSSTKTVKKATSKAAEAQKVFDRMYPKVVEGEKARKDVIAEFVSKVGLTPNGAATYFQKMKKAYTK